MKKTRPSPPHRVLISLVVVFTVVTPLTGSAGILTTASDDDPRLAEAHRLFNEAEYDSTLVVLEALAGDETLPEENQQETYRLLGLVHTIVGDVDAARAALGRLIALNPDAVAVDPDRDMLAFVRLYYSERKAYNEEHFCLPDFEPPHPCQYHVERPDPGIKTIAIVDFDNNAVDERERLHPLTDGLSDLMIRLLNGQTGLQIVERERLDWLLEEIDLSQQDAVDERTALRVGHLMGAHTVLLGDFMYLNNTFTLGARLVKVETGEVLLVADEDGRLRNLSEIAGALSETLARAILPNVESGPWEGRSPTNDLGALLAYAEGLSLLDLGKHEAAAEKFGEALVLDPRHEPARKRYDALRPQLASTNGAGK